jgi:hypothetical protein
MALAASLIHNWNMREIAACLKSSEESLVSHDWWSSVSFYDIKKSIYTMPLMTPTSRWNFSWTLSIKLSILNLEMIVD